MLRSRAAGAAPATAASHFRRGGTFREDDAADPRVPSSGRQGIGCEREVRGAPRKRAPAPPPRQQPRISGVVALVVEMTKPIYTFRPRVGIRDAEVPAFGTRALLVAAGTRRPRSLLHDVTGLPDCWLEISIHEYFSTSNRNSYTSSWNIGFREKK